MRRGWAPGLPAQTRGRCSTKQPVEGNHLVLRSSNILIRDLIREGKIDEARAVFDHMPSRNAVSWNSMIMGYSFSSSSSPGGGRGRRTTSREGTHAALKLFLVMPDRLKDAFTWTTAAGGLARAGRLSDALRLLKQSRGPQPEAWAAAVSGAQYRGAAAQALQIFREMLSRGGIARPAPHSFTSAAAAAADLSALSVGLQLLSHVMRRGLFSGNTLVANSLVSVFSKSGSLGDALRLFGLMRLRDVGSWNAIIGGLGCHGRGGEAITMFDRMRAAGFRPDWISFVGLLQGCSHCGRVDEGRRFFESMERDFGVRRRAEHYACMADLLARAGMLQEAAALAAALPADLAAASPRSLLVLRRASLRGCRGRSRRGELQADGGPAAQQRCCPEGRATGKGEVGCSWVQVRETVHLFAARDETHPQSPDIYAVLRLLNDAMTQH